ncbi:uncharacterized protein LY79DRAFT_573993 [Colletotrichum navitas]|uniref:Uncharacterized protein n=1 Tax=Colletotrichum navitas TaxID=681940 RepID=A0AAD8UWV6_9PEZI|nr:uncharacterized protein LY79DRAFT_573993 [Colletotrichum navitas]KAK1561663.1 hypothetical protein LY79DRAFT_573993 [Colletotrichum navitas]
MYPINSLIVFLLLIYSTFAAPTSKPKLTPTPRNPENPKWQPLRAGGGIYNVKSLSSIGLYYIYTPYYQDSREPVTALQLHKGEDKLTILQAWNAYEGFHRNNSPRLKLSDVIRAVAKEQAHVDLGSLTKVVVDTVINKPTITVVNDFFADWEKLQSKPNQLRPPKVTLTPSSSYWPAFQTTPFVKAVNYALARDKKMVTTISIVTTEMKTTNLLFSLGPKPNIGISK